MKQSMKKMAMLLWVVTIAAGAISCENKAKKAAEEAAKQEMLIKQQEEAAKQEMLIKQQEEAARLEQERIEQERAKNLIITPPKSVSDLRNRIIGTIWTVEHRDSEGIYPIFEFDGSMVYEYSVWKGKKELRNRNSYTIKEDFESDCYLIEFGDNYDIGNLKKIFLFVNGTNKVVLYEPATNSKDYLQLIN